MLMSSLICNYEKIQETFKNSAEEATVAAVTQVRRCTDQQQICEVNMK